MSIYSDSFERELDKFICKNGVVANNCLIPYWWYLGICEECKVSPYIKNGYIKTMLGVKLTPVMFPDDKIIFFNE